MSAKRGPFGRAPPGWKDRQGSKPVEIQRLCNLLGVYRLRLPLGNSSVARRQSFHLAGSLASGRVITSLDVKSFHTLRIPHRFFAALTRGSCESCLVRTWREFRERSLRRFFLSIRNYAFAASTTSFACFACDWSVNLKLKTLTLDIPLTLLNRRVLHS